MEHIGTNKVKLYIRVDSLVFIMYFKYQAVTGYGFPRYIVSIIRTIKSCVL
jgi:hypothetical protein